MKPLGPASTALHMTLRLYSTRRVKAPPTYFYRVVSIIYACSLWHLYPFNPRVCVNANSCLPVQIWALHTATIRSYGSIIDLLTDPPRRLGALEIYNNLLRFELLYPPEELIAGVDLNLFDLHEAVLAIAEGALVNDRYLDNLMKHFKSVRQQVRKRLKPMPKNGPIGV